MTDLRERLGLLAERGTPIGSSELRDRVMLELASGPGTRAPGLPPTARRRGLAVAAAAFVAVLILGAAALLLTRGGEVSPERTIETPPSTTMPESTTEASPSTTVPPTVDSWQRVGGDVMDPVVGLFDMTQAGPGLMAAGFDPGEDFRQDGVIFVSDDGVTWTRLAEDDPALTTGTVLIYGITDTDSGVVAVGMSCEDDAFPCESGPFPTVWTSPDGTLWTRSVVATDHFGAMLDVVATDHGIVAAGWINGVGADEVAWTSPVVWLSADGADWSRVWEGDRMWGDPWSGDDSIAAVGALAVGPDGLIVGGGSAENELGNAGAAAWISTDAHSWERIEPNLPAFASGIMLDVTWGSAGFVAVGSEGGSQVAIWHSLDGRSWVRVDTADQPFYSTGSLGSVAVLESGFITAGPGIFVGPGPVTLWTSPDGFTWDRVLDLGTGYAQALVVTDTGIAAAGGMPEANDYHAAVWAGHTFDPNTPPPEPQPPIPPEPEEGTEDDIATGIGALEEGVSCEAIAEQGFGYAEALSYWLRYQLTEDFDLDADGAPCADVYTAVEVSAAFGEPDALAVHLVSDHPTGTFEATGPAVEAGLVCAAGTIGYTPNPEPSEPSALWRWEDRYTCDDGSGMFLLGVDEYIEDGPSMYGVWNIVSGTGAYETLQGGGGTDSVFDGYDASIGRLWLEPNEN